MKKQGFTLAEVLITLGIVGVVAALTLPTLTQKTGNAKIPPALGKSVANFEQAAKNILAKNEADSLLGAKICGTGCYTWRGGDGLPASTADQNAVSNFWDNMSEYLQGAKVPANKLPVGMKNTFTKYGFQAADGTLYAIVSGFLPIFPRKRDNNQLYETDPSRLTIGQDLVIDVNGEKEPNKDGRDRFYFFLMEDGSLIPYGSEETTIFGGLNQSWRTACPANEAPSEANAKYCTGHIFANGMKINYK